MINRGTVSVGNLVMPKIMNTIEYSMAKHFRAAALKFIKIENQNIKTSVAAPLPLTLLSALLN